MNRRLTDAQIESGVDILRRDGRRIDWRSLQALLKARYGAAGRTDRLRSACRAAQQRPPAAQPPDWEQHVAQLQQRRVDAEQARDQALARALRSEEREIAHQDRWAAEIHRLRETVEQLRGERARRQSLEEQLVRVQRELQSAYARLERYES